MGRTSTHALRSLLREYFPAALSAFPDLTTRTALLVLAVAPTPTAAAALTQQDLIELLRRAGRGTQTSKAAQLQLGEIVLARTRARVRRGLVAGHAQR